MATAHRLRHPGTIEEIGDEVAGLSVGDNVVVEPYFVCDECPPCKAGNYHLCEKMGFIGLAGGGGGLSEKVLKEIDLRGTIAYVRDHAATIALVQEGKIDLKPFITGRIALEDLITDGFDTLINHNDTAVKILVHP